jgi:hypothetical protein
MIQIIRSPASFFAAEGFPILLGESARRRTSGNDVPEDVDTVIHILIFRLKKPRERQTACFLDLKRKFTL